MEDSRAATLNNRIKLKLNTQGLKCDEDHTKGEDGELQLEEQVILRLPPEIANQVREKVDSREVDDSIEIKFKDERRALFRWKDKTYSARLVDLPTILESSRTFDKKQILKVADICQMLLVEDEMSEQAWQSLPPLKKCEYIYPHGIAPAFKYVRDRRFRPHLSKSKVETIEDEVNRLLDEDAQAMAVNYEIIDVQGDEVDVGTPRLESIQGDVGFDVSSTAHLDDDEASSMAADEFDPELAAQFGRRLKELEGDEDEDEDDGDMERGDIDEGEDEEEEDEGEMGLDVFGDEDESGDVNGGGNRLQDEDEEEEEFDDESDFEGDSDADQPGNEQAKQKLLLSEEIAELKGTIERKKKDSDTAPNPIIKKRFEDVIQKLTAELVTKQSQLSALENEDRHDVKGDDDASKDSWGNPRPDSNVAAGPIPDAAGNQMAADGSGNILNYSDDGDVFESPVSSPRVDPDT